MHMRNKRLHPLVEDMVQAAPSMMIARAALSGCGIA